MARKRSLREKLEVARAETRGMRHALAKLPTDEAPEIHAAPFGGGDPKRFVQIVGVQRGYSAFLHALDASGQVWELHTLFGPKEQGEKSGPIVDQWWSRVAMDRR